MTMEAQRDRYTDALEAMRRCYVALEGCSDIETRASLWAACKRYAKAAREAVYGRGAGGTATPTLSAACGYE